MVYETFQQTITNRLKERLGSEYQLLLRRIPKNNGIILDGLCISPNGYSVAPIVYLNYYYERFLQGRPLDALVEEIVNVCRQNADILHVDFSMLNDFGCLKDRITYRLINTGANYFLLDDLVSIPFQDLSIVFCLLLEKGPSGQMTTMIRKRHLKQWDITTADLLNLAERNTPLLLPPELKSMQEVMDGIAREHMGNQYYPGIIDVILPDRESAPLYVLTNTAGTHGACVMLYPGILKNFAETLDRDLVILPSSIHEVLLVPYDENTAFDELSDMVAGINQSEVAVEDRLSDHVYFYSRTADEIILAHDSASAYVS